MNWLTKSVLPKIKAFVNKEETKQNLWIKCNSCDQMIFEKDLNKNFNICTTCNFHMPLYHPDQFHQDYYWCKYIGTEEVL